ncbi:unnamed protein product, partial [Trichogramma brassicae]
IGIGTQGLGIQETSTEHRFSDGEATEFVFARADAVELSLFNRRAIQTYTSMNRSVQAKTVIHNYTANPCRDHIFHVTFPKQWRINDLTQLFNPYALCREESIVSSHFANFYRLLRDGESSPTKVEAGQGEGANDVDADEAAPLHPSTAGATKTQQQSNEGWEVASGNHENTTQLEAGNYSKVKAKSRGSVAEEFSLVRKVRLKSWPARASNAQPPSLAASTRYTLLSDLAGSDENDDADDNDDDDEQLPAETKAASWTRSSPKKALARGPGSPRRRSVAASAAAAAAACRQSSKRLQNAKRFKKRPKISCFIAPIADFSHVSSGSNTHESSDQASASFASDFGKICFGERQALGESSDWRRSRRCYLDACAKQCYRSDATASFTRPAFRYLYLWSTKQQLSNVYQPYVHTEKSRANFNDEVHQLLRVNDRDHLGRIPLHEVLLHSHKHVAESLLRSGADPNMANADGSTPLHFICKRSDDDGLAKLFFEVNAEIGRVVQVDAVDNLGRTPLQWAVANLLPDTVDVILDHGADLCNFVYPTQSFFEECYEAKYLWNRSKLKIAISTPLIVENLENRGYKLDLSDVLTIMKLFAKYNLFPQSQYKTEEYLRGNKKFVSIANEQVVSPNLSLYDLVCLGSEEAAKQVSIINMLCFARSNQFGRECYRSEIDTFLGEVIAGRFCRRWAPEFFVKLLRHRLPILCCDVIIKNLESKDLWHICLAAMSEN